VSGADELIREAQYAFRNIGHGSTDEKKYRARAVKYAKQVIRKYPTSIESSQARAILNQLNVKIVVQSPPATSPQADAAAKFEKSHSAESGHTKNFISMPSVPDADFQQSGGDTDDWRDLIRRLMLLPPRKKRLLGIIAFVAVVFPGGIFVISAGIIFYALQTALLKKHLNLLLNMLNAE